MSDTPAKGKGTPAALRPVSSISPAPSTNGTSIDTRNELEREIGKQLIFMKARDKARELYAKEQARQEPALLQDMLTREDLRNLPESAPMIPGILMQESLMFLAGRDSTFKTFTALDWALCLATGTPWNGQEVSMPEDRPSVLYVAAEGAYTLNTRIDAWEEHRGVKVPDGGMRGSTWYTYPKAINLFDGPKIDEFVNLIRHHSDVGLVVLDTLRRVSGGAEQNGSDMGVVIDNISRVKEATCGGSVLVLAHTDKGDNDIRGSSLLEDDADIVWHAKADGTDKVRLMNRKMKNGPMHPDITLVTEKVGRSLVMRPLDPFEDGGEAALSTDAEILGVLREFFTDEGATAAEIRQVIGEQRGGSKGPMPKATFFKSVKRLKEKGRVSQHGQRYTSVATPE